MSGNRQIHGRTSIAPYTRANSIKICSRYSIKISGFDAPDIHALALGIASDGRGFARD